MRPEYEDILFPTTGGSFANQLRREAGMKTDVDHSHVLKGIRDYVDNLSDEPFWNDGFRETLGYLARVHGAITAERFLEHLTELPQDEDNQLIGVEDYTSLSEKSFRRLGKIVGAQFTRSYPEVIGYSINPDQYYTAVEQATFDGGKAFARDFAYFLPSVLHHTDMDDFRLASTAVKHQSDLPMAKTFMQSAQIVAEITNKPLQESAQTAIESIVRLGSEATRWGYPGIELLAEFGDYSPDEFMLDAEDVGQNLDPSYISWFTRGLLRIGETQRIMANLPERGNYMDLVNGQVGFKFFAYPTYEVSDRQALLSPKQFKDSFMRMAHLGKKSAAVLYSRIFDPMNMQDSEDLIYDAYETFGPKQFRSSSWLIQQAASREGIGPKTLRSMLNEIIELHYYGGNEMIEEVVAYNMWMLKHGRTQGTISLPQRYKHIFETSDQVDLSIYGYLATESTDEEIPF